MNRVTWINCTGDVVAGDTIRFVEGVFEGSFKNPRHLGDRVVVAEVMKDSYGEAKQQHTFSMKVVESSGCEAHEPGRKLRRKGRNVYRNGTERLEWADEKVRDNAAGEKHGRGDSARRARDARRMQEAF